MLKNVLVIVGLAVLAFIIFIVAFASFNKTVQKLMKLLYEDKDVEGYQELSNTLLCKVFLSKKQKLIFDITMYRYLNDDEMLERVFATLSKMKLSDQESLDLYYNVFKYYLRKKKYPALNEIYEGIKNKYKDNTNAYIQGNLKEFYYMYEIDYKGNTELLKEVDNLYRKITVDQSRGVFAFRCFHLANAKKDNKAAQEYLDDAIKYLGKDVVKDLINEQHIEYVLK